MRKELQVAPRIALAIVNALDNTRDTELHAFFHEHFAVEMPTPVSRVAWVKQTRLPHESLAAALDRYNKAIKVFQRT